MVGNKCYAVVVSTVATIFLLFRTVAYMTFRRPRVLRRFHRNSTAGQGWVQGEVGYGGVCSVCGRKRAEKE